MPAWERRCIGESPFGPIVTRVRGGGKNKIAALWSIATVRREEQFIRKMVLAPKAGVEGGGVGTMCIFFLTFASNNLIYESHCDLRSQI